jgi:microcin C transport system substrate-binding protein
LKEAGWIVRDGTLVNEKTGQPFEFELLLDSPAFERVGLAFARNLKRLGITMRIRTVDTAQYQRRIDNFDFDMTVEVFAQSLSPGNEQRDFWGSLAAGEPGSRNIVGIKDPVVDALIDILIAAPDRQSLIDRTRALDRVLLWNFYVIPNWHSRTFRVVYWDMFGHPPVAPKYDFGFNTWWIDAGKAASLAERRRTMQSQEKK